MQTEYESEEMDLVVFPGKVTLLQWFSDSLVAELTYRRLRTHVGIFSVTCCRWCARTKNVFGVLPLIGPLADWAYELIESIQSYHFYISAS